LRRRHQPSVGELSAFESVARHGNFTRAALELNLAQSAVSRQVRNLETKLRVELFERVNQRVVLTTAGRVFLPEVKSIILRIADASQRIMSFSGYNEVINLGVLPTFATRWLLPRLPQFLDFHPSITINFETRFKVFDFADTPLDAAIHYGGASWPGARVQHLMDEEMIPVVCTGYSNKLRLKEPSDLLRATLLHQSTRPSAWEEWFATHGVVSELPSRGAWFEQFAMVAQAAVCGLGAALLPRILIEEELQSGRLIVPFECSLRTAAAYYVAIPYGKGPPTSLFSDWIVDTAKQFVDHKSA
jgi:LysR family glycine cleavage system transcriptional activator